MKKILLEGYTPDEILNFSQEQVDALILTDEALVLAIGSASILGKFKIQGDTFVIELGHIDGGGEGALPALAAMAARYARQRKLAHIEWRVHALHCAKPNLKLRRVLERRGFVVRDVEGAGECYWLRVACADSD